MNHSHNPENQGPSHDNPSTHLSPDSAYTPVQGAEEPHQTSESIASASAPRDSSAAEAFTRPTSPIQPNETEPSDMTIVRAHAKRIVGPTVGRLSTHARKSVGVSRTFEFSRLDRSAAASLTHRTRRLGSRALDIVLRRTDDTAVPNSGSSKAPEHPGERYDYTTRHGVGQFTLLANGEYVQSEHDRRTKKLIWTTEESPADFLREVRKQFGDGTLGSLRITTAGGATTKVPLRDVEAFMTKNRISVITCGGGPITIGWRAPVAKLPTGEPRSECLVLADVLPVAMVQTLFESTGTAHVAKEGVEVLGNLDVLSKS